MKKLYTTFVAVIVLIQFSYAQWSTGTDIHNTNSGKVGIGSTTPFTTFDVNSTVAGVARFYTSSSGNTSNIVINNNSNWNYGVMGVVSGTGASNGDVYGLGYISNPNSSFTPALNWTSTGNVGIGTTTPSKLLTLSTFGSGSTVSSLLRLEQYNAGSPVGGTGVSIDMAIGDNYNLPNIAGQIRLVRSNYNNTTMYFATALSNIVTDRMIIDPNGNVAIGTSDSQGYKLAVNGNAIAESITVKLHGAWPDFVFKKDYKLPSLLEVKNYIDKNQHLPDVPSEQEVSKNGINLGDIVQIQTKKIEELTLYAIDQQKQIDMLKQQQKETQSQQDQINDLKKQLISLTKAVTQN